MTLTLRSRLLLMTLGWLLPALVAGWWAVDHTVQAEREALERSLRDRTQTLANQVEAAMGGHGPREPRALQTVTPGTAELQRILDGQALPAGWDSAIFDPSNRVLARQPGTTVPLAGFGMATPPGRPDTATEGLFDSVLPDGRASIAYRMTSAQGWMFVTSSPLPEFGGYLEAPVWQVALGGLALAALGLVAAMWGSRGVVHATRALPCTAPGPRLETLGRLTGGLAHDFNNLLGVISNSAHLMQRHAAGQPGLAAPVAATLRAVEAGSRLTGHLTRLARARPVHPQAVDLHRFLPEFEELLRSVVGNRIAVHIAIDRGTPAVQVDAAELELVLVHLALDARDALAQSGGTFWLQARAARPDEPTPCPGAPYALLSIGDSGHAAEPAPGAAQVEAFARQAGGRATWACGAEGGTTVMLLLPAAAPAPTGPAVRARSSQGAPSKHPVAVSPGAQTLLGLRVMLVEDNRELGEVTAALMQSCGAEVVSATDALTALDHLGRGTLPDVVLTDIVMPGPMDGVALAQEIQRRHGPLPVVLISGYTGQAPLPGEFPLLRKPCTPAELIGALTVAAGAPQQRLRQSLPQPLPQPLPPESPLAQAAMARQSRPGLR